MEFTILWSLTLVYRYITKEGLLVVETENGIWKNGHKKRDKYLGTRRRRLWM